MIKINILWADDEIDLLKPHILFLEAKGYNVLAANSGDDALDLLRDNDVDIVFLDENMPGLSGLETLEQMKNIQPNLPIVMITKSEEEDVMEEAIGSNIADYLIKPVNPNQILLCLKKNLDNRRLVSEKTTFSYQQEFRKIGMEISVSLSHEEWKEIYKKLVYWELSLDKSGDQSMNEILAMQKNDANTVFSKFVQNNYIDWLDAKHDDKPVQSHTLLSKKVLPHVSKEKPTVLVVIDNFRYDQWKVLQPMFEENYRIEEDDIFYSILPTATQYSRNSIFSGLLPSEIAKKYPQYWLNEDEEGTKNQYESELIEELLKRYGKSSLKYSYTKILNLNAGKKFVDNLNNIMDNDLIVIVYNFVDMLSHARTDMAVIRELAEDESAYRSITKSWFEHSPLKEVFDFMAEQDVNMFITTDHGAVKVDNPVKILGDKTVNTNLRYKVGRNMNYKEKDVFEVRNPEKIYLPKLNVSSTYVFAHNTDFFAYPNNYNYYVNYYRNTFQHGGISMEEMLIPIIKMKPKNN